MQLALKLVSRAVTGKQKLPVTAKRQDGGGKNSDVTGVTGRFLFIARARHLHRLYILYGSIEICP